jgi:hypothetical protein
MASMGEVWQYVMDTTAPLADMIIIHERNNLQYDETLMTNLV